MGRTKTTGKTIGEVEKLTGIPKRKLKYMIERGVMRPSQRAETGFWLYSEEDVRTARTIALLQRLGCPEKAIRAVLAAPAPRWPEALERQTVRLMERKDDIEDRLFLAELLRHRDDLQTDAGAFSPVGDSAPAAWEGGRKAALCRFLCRIFSEAEAGTPLYELSLLTELPPGDPAIQEQVRRLCGLLRQSSALSPAQLLLILRLAHTLSGLVPALDALMRTEGAVRSLTAAMQYYCEHQ